MASGRCVMMVGINNQDRGGRGLFFQFARRIFLKFVAAEVRKHHFCVTQTEVHCSFLHLIAELRGSFFMRATTSVNFILLGLTMATWLQQLFLVLLVATSCHSFGTPCKPRRSTALYEYKFGDFTKGLVQKVTGKNDYQFGDLTQWAVEQATNQTIAEYRFGDITKSTIQKITGQETYQFGDLTKHAVSVLESSVSNYTGRESYAVGDITREVIRRTWLGEYDASDIYLVAKILVAVGVQFLPIARFFPTHVLLEVLNVGLAQEVIGRVSQEAAKVVDERFKQALTGDPKYQLGDLTKSKLQRAVADFTGKDEYQFGDISAALASRQISSQQQQQLRVDTQLSKEMTEWDKSMSIDEWDDKMETWIQHGRQ